MPYILAESVESSARGYPVLRALFFEYPEDPTSWTIDDQYMFGSRLLVAPLFESAEARRVYLPPGEWVDYQTGRSYAGARWHEIKAGQIPVVLLVRNHSVIPHVKVAQSTADIDWKDVELRVFSTDGAAVGGTFALPGGGLYPLTLNTSPGGYALQADPLRGRVSWRVTRPAPR
jgi:alpha-D-xyloside xylohydrolase